MKSLHLVQLHWWDTTHPGYLEAAKTLLQLARDGVVRQIGVTNFDLTHTKELVSAGIPIVSTQVGQICTFVCSDSLRASSLVYMFVCLFNVPYQPNP